MEQYFPVISRASSCRSISEEKRKKRTDTKYRPYPLKNVDSSCQDTFSRFREKIQQSDTKVSSSALTKFVLGTLSDESNPITHSDIRERSDHVVSISTGHQVADKPLDRGLYMKDRERKLAVQREVKFKNREGQVLSSVRAYIDGFLENTTDIEMKKIITGAGGVILPTSSGCTHIVTSMQLSGSKTQKLLTTKSRIKVHVVKPEWVIASIEAGKKLSEREYAIVKNSAIKPLQDMIRKEGGSRK